MSHVQIDWQRFCKTLHSPLLFGHRLATAASWQDKEPFAHFPRATADQQALLDLADLALNSLDDAFCELEDFGSIWATVRIKGK